MLSHDIVIAGEGTVLPAAAVRKQAPAVAEKRLAVHSGKQPTAARDGHEALAAPGKLEKPA